MIGIKFNQMYYLCVKSKTKTIMETLIKFLGIVALAIIVDLLLAFPTMWLWNWLMPIIFGLVKITFLQALGINVLCSILFKNSSTSNNNK